MSMSIGRAAMAGVFVTAVLMDGFVAEMNAAGDVAVTVTYKGKAKVDDTHEIWVFLFDTPELGPGVRPVGTQVVKQNGGTATFTGVTTDPVYIRIAYDEKGTTTAFPALRPQVRHWASTARTARRLRR